MAWAWGATGWTVVILVVVILSLFFLPNWSMMILIVIGKIVQAFKERKKTANPPPQGPQQDPLGSDAEDPPDPLQNPPCPAPDPELSLHRAEAQAPAVGAPAPPFCAPAPAFCGPSPAFCAPAPAFCAPSPAFCAPSPAGKNGREPESSSASSSSFGIKYEVFLNFRGTDTRKIIADRLHRALVDVGISVFKDDEELHVGEEILPQVKEAINQSRISIAILSTDYASNKGCLNELVQMWECRKLNRQTIIPIFYGISPSDVKNRVGDFGNAFELHETGTVDSSTKEKWRQVLREIGGLPGGYSGNLYKGYEDQLVEEVAVGVARILRDDGLVVTDKLVGIDLHVQEMMRKLNVVHSEGRATEVRGEDVRAVGICGVPGVGKTTLAKVVFNEMSDLFDACSFLPGVSSKGVQFSRRMLIADLQIQKPAPLESSGEGIEEIASLCHNVKVLIVLDSVDEDEQIKVLAGKLTWFGPGSRIIITTNKREVLSAFNVQEYEVKPMDHDHAYQLFCEHAFQGAAVQDVSEYFGLSMDIVEATGGLPSNIMRHASSLRGNMNMDTWNSTLEGLQKHPKDRPAASPVNDAGGSELPGGAPPSAGDASPPAGPLPPVGAPPPAGDDPASAVDAPARAGKKRREPESSSSSSRIQHDVYLSFKGGDAREFVSHLYAELGRAGIRVFKDSEVPLEGEKIWRRLKEEIERSWICIPILSPNFASSRWCLEELVQMWECGKYTGQTIIPIFYGVSPSAVRFQREDFGKALHRHEERGVDSNTIQTWEEVLRQITALKGFVAEKPNGHDGLLVKEVTCAVQALKKDDEVVTDKLVGIELHVKEMMRKLGVVYSEGQAIQVTGEDVRILGICGVPGVGKTTLAKVVYNKMFRLFDACSFIGDIRSVGVQRSRHVLISDLKKISAPFEPSAEEIEEIASLCRNAKVLIVLDNVDEDKQIKELVGKLTWFGPGSKIIVTTNKREVLSAFDDGAEDRGTVEEHEVKPMGDDHALQLFCKHAFHGAPVQDFYEYFSLSKDIVKASGGLPSEIVPLASSLRGRTDIDLWESTLEKLQEHPKDRPAASPVNDAGGSELRRSSPVHPDLPLRAPPPAGDALPPAVLPPPGGALPAPVDAPAPAGKKRRKPKSSSTSSSSSEIKHDVFLSFKSTDTIKIMDQLPKTLVEAGISVFKYDNEHHFEEDLWPEVKVAIERSRISIAILSTDYASEKSCLKELVQMRDCSISNGQTIIPIFYGISASDIKDQAGDFGTAFNQHKIAGVHSNTIETWRVVLQEIGGLPGYSLEDLNGCDGQLVEVAVRAARILRDDGLAVADKPVGIDLHVEEMMRKLGVTYSEGQVTEVHGEDPCVLGICGGPGIGKTTLAKVIFNKMGDLFDACSFLPGISSKGVQFSRRMLIADLQEQNPASLESSGKGIEEIESLCRNAKVLIVLDDVDEDEQIKALAGNLTWFGPGSRIIVTTNKSEVLSAFGVGADDPGTVKEHEVGPMSTEHALQLFRKLVFQGDAPKDVSRYESLSIDIVQAIGQRPSTIEDRASFFRSNMKIDEWRLALDLLQRAQASCL